MVKLKLVGGSRGVAENRKAPVAEPPRKATPKSEQTRLLLLEAAVDAINQHGVRGVNLARVAELAGVTRGCLQYYYMTSDEILVAVARHAARRSWEIYEELFTHPPDGRDPIEFAIDLVASPATNRYRVAQSELVNAARTMPILAPVLAEAAEAREAQEKRFTGMLFGKAELADTPQFRGARHLTRLVNDWMFVQVFPGDPEERRAEIMAALRIALHTLWRIPGLTNDADLAKPRVRVKARTSSPADEPPPPDYA